MKAQHVLVLLVWQLDGHGVECTHSSRSRTVLSELAFAVSPSSRSLGGAWTSRNSGSTGHTSAQQRVVGPCDRRGATTAPAAATRTSAAVRLEPLEGHRRSKKSGSRRARPTPSSPVSTDKTNTAAGAVATPPPPPAGSQQRRRKRQPTSRAPRKKGASRAAAAAAAVDPFPEESSFVTPVPAHGSVGSNGVGGTVLATVTATDIAGRIPAPKKSSSGSRAAATSSGKKSNVGKTGKYESSRGDGSSSSGNSGTGDSRRQRPTKAKRKYGDLSAKRAKALRTGGKAFLIVCDAESYTFPELVESIDLLDELGTRDVGVIYADWRNVEDWRSEPFGRSKARSFKLLQRDPLTPGSNPLGDDTMTADVVALARAEEFKKYEFCLLSGGASLSGLAARLRQEGRLVRGIGRRQAPQEFLDNCDAFMYIDPANRYELLDNEGLVISVALCIALAAAGQERCDWVRMKTIVNSLHAWDLGLESPNFFGYCDYDEVVAAMDTYVTGVEDTSGEVVVKVPPKPREGEVPRGLEDVATYLYQKWVSFTKEPQMNDILLACIPACLQALSAARAEMDMAVKRFQRDQGGLQLHNWDFLMD